MYKRFGKRFLDILLAGIGLFVLSPLFLLVPLLILFVDRYNPFFAQLRPGLHAKPFYILKFRTMADKFDRNRCLLPDEERITTLGKFLRSTSIDEMPQLFNILKGDMSLVGPRPLLMEYLSIYTESEQQRHTVRPGLTGWAQINGRNEVSLAKKLEFDLWYVQSISFKVDCYILWQTIKKVL